MDQGPTARLHPALLAHSLAAGTLQSQEELEGGRALAPGCSWLTLVLANVYCHRCLSSWAFCKLSEAHRSTSDTVSILGLPTCSGLLQRISSTSPWFLIKKKKGVKCRVGFVLPKGAHSAVPDLT